MRSSLVLLAGLALSGCASIGPTLVEDSQAHYAEALLTAEKQQMFLNILRLRDDDIPSIVHVDQIVAGYERRVLGGFGNSLSTEFNLTTDWSLRAEGSFAERPTITLRPLQGVDYARVFFRPVDPINLVGFLFGGAHPTTLFGLTVERINGVSNDLLDSNFGEANTGFRRIVRLLASLRDEGLIALQYEEVRAKDRFYLSVAETVGPPDPRISEFRALLNLDPNAARYEIAAQGAAPGSDKIVILTRPLIEILSDAASGLVDIRSEGTESPADEGALSIGVKRGLAPVAPDNAFVTARYRNRTYWIEHDDRASKRLFSMIILLARMSARAGDGPTPILTIPTN